MPTTTRGFWAEWFVEAFDQVRFIEHLLRWPCYGDPEFTFSDVERALRQEVRARDYLSTYRVIVDATLRAREVAVLEKREAKYPRPPASSNDVEERARRPSHEMSSPIPVPTVPVQGTLFQVIRVVPTHGGILGYPVYYSGAIEVQPPLQTLMPNLLKPL